jgi:hypothetical protein
MLAAPGLPARVEVEARGDVLPFEDDRPVEALGTDRAADDDPCWTVRSEQPARVPRSTRCTVLSEQPALSASLSTLGLVGTLLAVLAFSMLVDRPRPIRSLAALPLVADVDGNGRDELVLWDPSTGRWYSVDSDGRSLRSPDDIPMLGGDGDLPRRGDLDGDGADELFVWRPRLGEWLAWDPDSAEPFIVKDDSGGSLGFVADLDGDGRDDLVTWRSDWRAWSAMTLDGTSLFAGREVGHLGDVPLVGDFDGDGREELATWRPFSGQWLSQTAEEESLFEGVEWGQPGDVPVVADFDGDGRMDLAYWRAADGEWAARVAPMAASPGRAQVLFRGVRLGRSGDLPLVGDFDGDGRADVSIWRPSDHLWSGLTRQGRSRFDVDTRIGPGRDPESRCLGEGPDDRSPTGSFARPPPRTVRRGTESGARLLFMITS